PSAVLAHDGVDLAGEEAEVDGGERLDAGKALRDGLHLEHRHRVAHRALPGGGGAATRACSSFVPLSSLIPAPSVLPIREFLRRDLLREDALLGDDALGEG